MVEGSVRSLTRTRVYGVDFSGARTAGRKIWITQAVVRGGFLRVERCASAAVLLGVNPEREVCLEALRILIAREQEAVFGLDFPFSVPMPLVGATSWEEFVCTFSKRYTTPHQFRAACYAAAGARELKRLTDRENGTPWASYNLRLYRQTFYGITGVLAPLVSDGLACVLPMQLARADQAWLVEICPAATLKRHGLYAPYKGDTARHHNTRCRILEAVERLAPLQLADAALREVIVEEEDGDALDSIVAAWATWRALQQLPDCTGMSHPEYALEGYVYS